MSQARIMLLEEEETLSRPLQDDLEQRGLAAACIAAAEDEEAGLAFGPNIVVLNPETGIKNGFGLIRKMAETAPSTPLIIARSPNPALNRAAKAEARSFSVPMMGAVDRPYPLTALEHYTTECPSHRPPGETGDQAFLKSLIAHDRLIPNLTVEFQSKHNLKTDTVVGYEALTRLKPRRALSPELIFSQSIHLDLEFEATLVILDAAVRFAVALERMERTKTVSFNCSAPQFWCAANLSIRSVKPLRDMRSFRSV
ncbi:EAL domain-containing protein [Parasphingopyxis algicola]|uniref:EAL domain-containing protein n=1 Tax=Parasphingopyxis algicola TaxID=2026624 RepID=UPI0015A0C010|nr:EAL domain-containing protein [Parasphingopyxis algicola]QLC23952.1 EAL domain-containing protein [Parasphingopyxis algicola]